MIGSALHPEAGPASSLQQGQSPWYSVHEGVLEHPKFKLKPGLQWLAAAADAPHLRHGQSAVMNSPSRALASTCRAGRPDPTPRHAGSDSELPLRAPPVAAVTVRVTGPGTVTVPGTAGR
jgi:hypothetical protein